MNQRLPDDWYSVLKPDIESDYFAALMAYVDAERSEFDVYPTDADVFKALQLTPLETVRVVILGQDPYHGAGQAHGLCFSVPDNVAKPPSLKNIMRELTCDLGCTEPASGCLTPWARQGVLLLNTVLTVRAHQPNSHSGRGWERLTDSIISAVNHKSGSCVFLLWGAHAQRKKSMLDAERHTIVEAPHPSPLSARSGFFGSRPFTRANKALSEYGDAPIDWRLQNR